MEKAIVVRLKKGKKTFEILTHHGTVEPWRAGTGSWDAVPVLDRVIDHKGEPWTKADLMEAFETDDTTAVMQEVARKGELQHNAEVGGGVARARTVDQA